MTAVYHLSKININYGKLNLKDLIGQKFGLLTVVSKSDLEKLSADQIRRYAKRGTFWNVKCDCGRASDVCGADLISGNTTSCGCKKYGWKYVNRYLVGQRFGHLVVLENQGRHYKYRWSCKCDCGKSVNVATRLLIENIKTCCNNNCRFARNVIQPGTLHGKLTCIEWLRKEGDLNIYKWRCVCENIIEASAKLEHCGCRRKLAKQTKDRRHVLIIKLFILNYLKSHPCVDCGNADPAILEFDHVRGKKKFGIGTDARKRTLSAVKKEIKKCEIRCANCHRKRHRIEQNAFKLWTSEQIKQAEDEIKRLEPMANRFKDEKFWNEELGL